MSNGSSRQPDPPNDEVRLDDLPARPADNPDAAVRKPGSFGVPIPRVGSDTADDDVIRIEDLTPRENVSGGRKVILGEVATRPEEQKP